MKDWSESINFPAVNRRQDLEKKKLNKIKLIYQHLSTKHKIEEVGRILCMQYDIIRI